MNGKNKKSIIFDIDGTLFDYDYKPREEVINMMRSFNTLGWKIFCHSGGGVQYCQQKVMELGLDKEMHITITPKGSPDYMFDIAVDDMDLDIDNTLVVEQGRKYRIKAKYFIKV